MQTIPKPAPTPSPPTPPLSPHLLCIVPIELPKCLSPLPTSGIQSLPINSSALPASAYASRPITCSRKQESGSPSGCPQNPDIKVVIFLANRYLEREREAYCHGQACWTNFSPRQSSNLRQNDGSRDFWQAPCLQLDSG